MRKYAEFIQVEDGIELIRINSTAPSKEEFDDYFDNFLKLLTNLTHMTILVVDISEAKIASASQRAQAGYFHREQRHLFKEKLSGLVYITASPLMKMALNGVFFIGPPPIDFKVVQKEETAILWARKKLDLVEADQ